MSNSSTIARNTLLLYFRMFLIMGVTLYTSRIVLNELGVSDYGVYSLVGGIVAMLGFFNAAMSSATQRYLSFDIGKGDLNQLQKTFSSTLTIHMFIAVFALLLAETVGLWFVNYKMIFPEDRLYAVNIVYQFSVFTFLLNIVQVPYNALIIARERMNVYAYVSILEVVLKLTIVFLLVFGNDKLILYSILTFIVAFIIRMIYKVYCKMQFIESKYKFVYDKVYLGELLSYSGWNLFGNFAAVARGQGVNMVLNLFFGTVVNAAYGITMQVQSAILMFVNNFQLAVNPQIIKQYAKGDVKASIKLMYNASKYSFYLSLIIILPVLMETDKLLSLWLGNQVPDYTISFVKLCLISVLIDSLSGPLMTMVQATGKVKNYQIVVGFIVFLNLPLAYFGLKIFKDPDIVFYILILSSVLALFFRLVFVRSILAVKTTDFVTKVFFPVLFVFSVSIGFLKLIGYSLENFLFSGFLIVLKLLFYSITICLIVFFMGINKKDRDFFYKIIKR